MPGSVNGDNVIPISYTPTNGNGETGSRTPPIPAPRKINSTARNNALLIFDFNQAIINDFMCNFFACKEYSDYDSGKENAVTEEKIKELLQNQEIKNEERLKHILQSALSSGVEVAIVSLTYPKVVEYVVKNRLEEGQAQSIKVFEGTTKRQDPLDSAKVVEGMNKPQDPQIGKHLCVLYLLKAYKDKHGKLPKEVMLVDGNHRGINPANDFHKSIEKELLKKDMGSFLENIDQEIAKVDIKEEINSIAFKGINVSGTDGAVNDGYLDEVEKWIEKLIQNLENPVDDDPENHIYATIDLSKKTLKESLDSEIGDQNSEEKDPSKKVGLSGSTPLTPPPSYDADDSEKSLLLDSEFDTNSNVTLESKKANRIWPRAKYAMQQKGFIIFNATAIMLGASAALVHLQDKVKFAALFANSPLYVTIPVVALASLLVILPIYLAVKQFRNTKECQTQGKNADEILDKMLEHQPKDKVIKSVRLEYSNGTHSNFVLNAWESKNNFINIDEKIISKTNKIKSVINDRPLFTVLLTSVIAANVALPLGLLAVDGVSGVQIFYQNFLTNNIGLSLHIGSGALLLLILCLGVHYYRKANCTNLIYSQEKIDPNKVNKELIEEIKRERTNVLGENHSKDAKRCSLTLEQVVVQSHNYPDVVYGINC